MGSTRRLVVTSAIAGALLAVPAGSASATVFSNTNPITINNNNKATPYPASIDVNATGTITDVNVTLHGFGHTEPIEVAVSVAAPNGEAMMLQSGSGGSTDVTGLTYTFDDAAPGQIPDNAALTSTVYKPANHDPGLPFAAPGPSSYHNPGPEIGGGNPPGATLASAFNGDPAGGTWKLFVHDFGATDSGAISGGWSLNVTTTAPAQDPPTSPPDSDGDGVPDSSDQCATQAGPASNAGCPESTPPTDSDGDGVADASDNCPSQAGPAANGGCPLASSAGDETEATCDAARDRLDRAKAKLRRLKRNDAPSRAIEKAKEKAKEAKEAAKEACASG